jgi:hypothetical protein
MFEQIDDSKSLAVVFESAEFTHQIIEDLLASMAKGRVSQIVGQANRLSKIIVDSKLLCNRPAYLGDLDAVCEACSVVVIQAGCEYLRFAFEAAKGRTVDYTVAVALEA